MKKTIVLLMLFCFAAAPVWAAETAKKVETSVQANVPQATAPTSPAVDMTQSQRSIPVDSVDVEAVAKTEGEIQAGRTVSEMKPYHGNELTPLDEMNAIAQSASQEIKEKE